MAKEGKHLLEFGPFRIDPEERLLLRGEEQIPLPPKAFETLLILVSRSERVVLKEDLMRSLWPDTFVEEANLSQNIFVLRKASPGGNCPRCPLYRYRARARLPLRHEGKGDFQRRRRAGGGEPYDSSRDH